ncbi:[SSU ribosomal protein S18P]-alanine acetyltransferase [Desulfonispora thiosulfatigenes DSM 11270]|uniref:[SSU ribosomal protein S18P]-alanine acetyltransferase n=1 Tax=Desulfonispora thiosulfatigenes DSM 11270 TaxID=656914 RepID=A0A1W1V8G1_DESTI|nr:ribosomal protein S18-alanine N-acetyltransferase [Desulfonispora thiosulfatigenes]SMB89719.1 [SSU ribosomal protein S18P]-alanine acetyltransferase [Desulfonispora thiosulfatigenes DSM 11270]
MCDEENQVIIRPMDFDDIEQIVEIEKACFSSPWSAYAFECELHDNQFANYLVVALAEDESKLVGYGGLWVIIDEGHITNIAILPEYRGKKLGELLMLNLIQIALAKDTTRMTLEVRASNNAAIKLYEKFGFKTEGVRKGYYIHPREDALIMWAKLV